MSLVAAGHVVSPETELAIEAFRGAERHPVAQANLAIGEGQWGPASPAGGYKVGWTLKQSGRQTASFAFKINPQSIARQGGSRTQLIATKRAFYVDDFGPAANTIQIQQLIGSGQGVRGNGEGFGSLRSEVLTFYENIYLRAVGDGYGNPVDTFFYDNHLFQGEPTTGQPALPERVFFPAGSFSLTRSVTLNNVWQMQIGMVVLTKPAPPPPFKGASGIRGTQVVIANADYTLHKLARWLLASAGERRPHHKRVHALETALLRLNHKLRTNREVQLYNASGTLISGEHVQVKRLHVRRGEKVIVPASHR